jgi:50S ribosomal protein L16 3-hydroxylase
MHNFVQQEVARWLAEPRALACALGEVLSEPKPQVWFEPGQALTAGCGVRLDRRTRMLYDDQHVFINGEAFRAAGGDARLMRRLSDDRALAPRQLAKLGDDARELLGQWAQAGWLHRVNE